MACRPPEQLVVLRLWRLMWIARCTCPYWARDVCSIDVGFQDPLYLVHVGEVPLKHTITRASLLFHYITNASLAERR